MWGKTSLISISQIFEYLISFLIAYVLISSYTIDAYGVWSHFIRVSTLTIVILSFEISTNYLYRHAGKTKSSSDTNLIFISVFYILLLTLIVIPLILYEEYIIQLLFNLEIFKGFLVILLYHVFSNIYFQLIESYYLVNNNYKLISTNIIIKQITKLVTIYLFIGTNDIFKIIVAFIFLDSIISVINIFIIFYKSKFKIQFTKKKLIYYLKINTIQSKYIFLGSLVITIFLFIDNYYMARYLNYETIGIYSLYLGINGISVIIITIVGKVFVADIISAYNNNQISDYREKVTVSINFILFWIIPMVAGTNIIAVRLIELISDSKVKYEFQTFLLFSLFYFLLNIFFYFRQIIDIKKMSKFFLYLATIMTITNILGMYVIKPTSIDTLMIIKVLTLTITTIITYLIISKDIKFKIKNILYIISSTGIFIVVYYILEKNYLNTIGNQALNLALIISISAFIYVTLDILRGKNSFFKYFYFKDYDHFDIIIIFKNLISRLIKIFDIRSKQSIGIIDNKIQFETSLSNKMNLSEEINNFMNKDSESYRKEIINELQKYNPKTILDFGCGYAMNIFGFLLTKNETNQIYFVDIKIDYFKNHINNCIKKIKTSSKFFFYSGIDDDIKEVECVHIDAVLMYLNKNKLKLLLNRIFNLNSKLIIIHDFSYNNLYSKIYNFLNDDKYLHNLEKKLKHYCYSNNYNINIKQSVKPGKYLKYGYTYIITKK
tara:strand:- start:573 stop:2732 length:2160 start_codon:yes stop_codon:yes gene_type:complete